MVDKIKRETRERMARTGEPYTEARRALPARPAARRRMPSAPPELRVAVDVLLRAWAPPPAPVDDPDPENEADWNDWTNGCNCAGEDEYGEPLGCNCGGGCSCKGCVHQDHAETRRCRLRVPREGQPYAWCGKPTRYRIGPYCLHRAGVIRMASEDDPAADRGDVRLGDSIQRHIATYACSTQHARALIEQDQQRRGNAEPDSPLSARNTFYEVETFRYDPDDIDVPGPLQPLRRDLESAAYWTREAIAGTFGVGRGSVDRDVEALLRNIAWSAQRAVEYIEHRDKELADLAADAG